MVKLNWIRNEYNIVDISVSVDAQTGQILSNLGPDVNQLLRIVSPSEDEECANDSIFQVSYGELVEAGLIEGGAYIAYDDNALLKICPDDNSLTCVEFDLESNFICEKHLTGGDYMGTSDRERIFGTHLESDNIFIQGEGDIINVRGSDIDTIVGGDSGSEIIYDP